MTGIFPVFDISRHEQKTKQQSPVEKAAKITNYEAIVSFGASFGCRMLAEKSCLRWTFDARSKNVRTTLRLSDELLRRAKRKAATDGRTLTSLVEEGLEMLLTNSKRSRRRPVKLPVSKMREGTLPDVDLNSTRDLEDRMNKL